MSSFSRETKLKVENSAVFNLERISKIPIWRWMRNLRYNQISDVSCVCDGVRAKSFIWDFYGLRPEAPFCYALDGFRRVRERAKFIDTNIFILCLFISFTFLIARIILFTVQCQRALNGSFRVLVAVDEHMEVETLMVRNSALVKLIEMRFLYFVFRFCSAAFQVVAMAILMAQV